MRAREVLSALTIGFALVGGAVRAQTATSSAPASQPVIDYLAPATYEQKLAPIEPAGFFEWGRRYVQPPRIEWKPVAGAARYQLLLVQGSSILGTMDAPASPQFLRAGWEKLKPGKAGVIIQAFGAGGRRIALSRLFPFHAALPFDPSVAAAQKRPYRDAALMAFNALFTFKLPPATSAPASGLASAILPVLLSCAGSSNGYAPYSFPALHDWEHVDMLESLLKIANEPLKAKIVTYARAVGDHLLLARLPAESNLYGNMVRGCVDYYGRPALGYPIADPALQEKMLRLIEPAKCGYAAEALVKVADMTGDAKYLDAAVAMAEVYAKTQLPDGSWHARVDGRTGEVLGAYSSSTGSVASFLNRLAPRRPDPRWQSMEERARAWMMANPMKTYGWVVNYDDGGAPATGANPYVGSLSNWDLFGFLRYLCRVHASVPSIVENISEQLAWNEGQFVFFGSDPLLPIEPFYPTCAEQGTPGGFASPSGCWLPMDFHTANWGRTLLDAHRLTKDPRWLAQARAAANALTQYQLDDGRTMTWMCDRTFGVSAHVAGTPGAHSFWPAAWALSASLWAELAAMGQ